MDHSQQEKSETKAKKTWALNLHNGSQLFPANDGTNERFKMPSYNI